MKNILTVVFATTIGWGVSFIVIYFLITDGLAQALRESLYGLLAAFIAVVTTLVKRKEIKERKNNEN